jgi:hypothetical protein
VGYQLRQQPRQICGYQKGGCAVEKLTSALKFILVLLVPAIFPFDILGSGSAGASETEPLERFTVRGDHLFIDLDKFYYEGSDVVLGNDTDSKVVGELLFYHSEIKNVLLTGQGGLVHSAEHIARLFMRHDITTIAYGECLSACAVMFLGGSERRLSKGAVIGLHRAQASVVDHMSFYEEMKAQRGWADEFAYAEWNYQDGQLLAKSVLELLLEQDIDPRVLVKAFGAGPDDLWRPSLKELEDLRIITNAEPSPRPQFQKDPM